MARAMISGGTDRPTARGKQTRNQSSLASGLGSSRSRAATARTSGPPVLVELVEDQVAREPRRGADGDRRRRLGREHGCVLERDESSEGNTEDDRPLKSQ